MFQIILVFKNVRIIPYKGVKPNWDIVPLIMMAPLKWIFFLDSQVSGTKLRDSPGQQEEGEGEEEEQEDDIRALLHCNHLRSEF